MRSSVWARFSSVRWGVLGTAAIALGAAALKWNSTLMPVGATPAASTAIPAIKDNARGYYSSAGQWLLPRSRNALKAAFWPLCGVNISADGTPTLFGRPTGLEREQLVAENKNALTVLRIGLQHSYQHSVVSVAEERQDDDNDNELAALLGLTGQVRAGRGDWDGAINADLDCIEFGSSMLSGAPLSTARQEFWRETPGRRNTWAVIDHLSGRQARAAAARIAGILASAEPYEAMLRTQKTVSQQALLAFFSHSDWRRTLLAESGYIDPGVLLTLRAHLISPRTLYAETDRFQDAAIRRALYAWPAQRAITAPLPPGEPLFANEGAWYLYSQLKQNTFTALNEMLMVALALRAYKADRGAYPARLGQLAPAYIPGVPLDPFSDHQPLRYRLADGKPLLYSIGPDAVDDGGQPIAAQPPSGRPLDWSDQYPKLISTGDLVAGSL